MSLLIHTIVSALRVLVEVSGALTLHANHSSDVAAQNRSLNRDMAVALYINSAGVELRRSGSVNSHAAASTGSQPRNGSALNDLFHVVNNDTVLGGAGDDSYVLWGSNWTVTERTNEGIDSIFVKYYGTATLPSHVENLFLEGEASTGGTGNALDNIIQAGTAGATLNGMAGNDVLIGGSGADLFVIAAGNGSDVIEGFTGGRDAVRLTGYNLTSFAQLKALGSQIGADTQFALPNGEKLILRGVTLSSLTPQDFGWFPEVAPLAPGQTRLAAAGNVGIANGWYALNNAWGAGSLVQGVDYIIKGAYSSADMTAGTTFTWSFPFVTDPSPQIKSYAEVLFGVNPHGNHTVNATDKAKVLPVKVADIASLLIDHDVSYLGHSAGFNVAYDIWFTSIPYGDASTVTTELMIWLHKGSFSPFGPIVGTVMVGGVSAQVYHSETYVALVLSSEVLDGVIDLKDVIGQLKALGIMSDSEYLASIDLGAEAVSGSGSLTINNLDFTLEQTVTGGTVIKTVTGAGTGVEMRTSASTYTATAEVIDISYTGAGAATLRGNALGNVVRGGALGDLLNLSDGGNDTALGGAGDDGIYFGKAFTPADIVDGGAGSNDQLGLQGNYDVTLGAQSLVGIETLALLSGADTRFGDAAGNSYAYTVRTIDANVAVGSTLIVNGAGLGTTERLTFDGTAESDGAFTIYAGAGIDVLKGGAGNDGFWFGNGKFAIGDRVDGGAGAENQMALSGRYTSQLVFSADTMTNIQTLALLSASDPRYGGSFGSAKYDIVLNDANVAADARLTVTGTALRAGETMSVDGSAETNAQLVLYGGLGDDRLTGGARGDILFGGGGADRLIGGGGGDRFLYASTSDSTVAVRDTITDFALGDFIDLSRIDAISGTAANDAFTFIGGQVFSGLAGQLRVAATAGGWLVEGDVNGDAAADLSIFVQTVAGYSIAAADLIL